MSSAKTAQEDTESTAEHSGRATYGGKTQVAGQITDAVALTNVMTLGLGPSYSALQSMLGQAQSQNVLMANMVSSQRQNAMVGMTTMTKSIQQIMNRR